MAAGSGGAGLEVAGVPPVTVEGEGTGLAGVASAIGVTGEGGESGKAGAPEGDDTVAGVCEVAGVEAGAEAGVEAGIADGTPAWVVGEGTLEGMLDVGSGVAPAVWDEEGAAGDVATGEAAVWLGPHRSQVALQLVLHNSTLYYTLLSYDVGH